MSSDEDYDSLSDDDQILSDNNSSDVDELDDDVGDVYGSDAGSDDSDDSSSGVDEDDEDEGEEEDEFDEGMDEVLAYLETVNIGSKITIEPANTVISLDLPNISNSLSSANLQDLPPIKSQSIEEILGSKKTAKRVEVEGEFEALNEALAAPDIAPLAMDSVVTGDLSKDLTLNYGESYDEFMLRSKITKALVMPPYKLGVPDALIAGKLWTKKSLFSTRYSDRVENALSNIQKRAAK